MKKFLSVILAVIMCAMVTVPAFAANMTSDLKFNADGKFKIMQIGDSQDFVITDLLQKEYVEKAIKQENPDLLVFTGDQLTDFYPGATKDGLTKCITNFFSMIEETGIPFIVTFGNHDHDHTDVLSLEEQMAIYKSYSNCIVPEDVCDTGTYNVPVMSSNGTNIALNIYMMDTHAKSNDGVLTGYEGVRPHQNEWYKQTSAELKAANGGKTVPSLLFQHIPVKEIYQLLDEVPFTADLTDAVYNLDENKWYVLNDNVIEGSLGETPCSEALTKVTGQYESWLETGDIIGAFFGHDHVNNFYGRTDDGILLGYNGGTGFSTYGRGGERSTRIFVIDEKDPANFETYEVTYNDVASKPISFWFIDLFSPTLATTIAKFLVSLIPNFVMEIIKAAA